MRAVLAVAAVAAVLSAAVPADAAGDPSTNQLGTVEMPAHPPTGPEPRGLPVTVELDDRALLDEANQILLSFNVHDTEAVDVSFDGLTTANGTPVPLVDEDRDRPAQPRVFVDGDALVNASTLHVDATVTTHANGRFHVGFMVIPFDDDWETLTLDGGGSAELYGFSVLAADGHAAEGLEPPLRGSGNQVPGPAPVALAVAAALTAAVAGSRSTGAARRP